MRLSLKIVLCLLILSLNNQCVKSSCLSSDAGCNLTALLLALVKAEKDGFLYVPFGNIPSSSGIQVYSVADAGTLDSAFQIDFGAGLFYWGSMHPNRTNYYTIVDVSGIAKLRHYRTDRESGRLNLIREYAQSGTLSVGGSVQVSPTAKYLFVSNDTNSCFYRLSNSGVPTLSNCVTTDANLPRPPAFLSNDSLAIARSDGDDFTVFQLSGNTYDLALDSLSGGNPSTATLSVNEKFVFGGSGSGLEAFRIDLNPFGLTSVSNNPGGVQDRGMIRNANGGVLYYSGSPPGGVFVVLYDETSGILTSLGANGDIIDGGNTEFFALNSGGTILYRAFANDGQIRLSPITGNTVLATPLHIETITAPHSLSFGDRAFY